MSEVVIWGPLCVFNVSIILNQLALLLQVTREFAGKRALMLIGVVELERPVIEAIASS